MANQDLDEQLVNIESLLNKLKSDFKQQLEDAYERGFDDGVATTPDHKAFHEQHKDPQHYGEDGEIIVISDKIPLEAAVKKIQKLMKSDYDEDYVEDVESHLHAEKIALAVDGDECSYYASRSRNGIFGAWVWRA